MTNDVIGKLVAYTWEWLGINGEVSGNSVGQLCSRHFKPLDMENDK